MKHNVPVTTIMTSAPRTAHAGQPLSEVRAMMNEGRFHVVPVVRGKALVGLVTASDLLQVSYTYGADDRMVDAVLDATVKLADLMTTEPTTLAPSDTVRHAVTLFAEGKFHALPVVDAAGELLGVVTTTDIMRYVLDQY